MLVDVAEVGLVDRGACQFIRKWDGGLMGGCGGGGLVDWLIGWLVDWLVGG